MPEAYEHGTRECVERLLQTVQAESVSTLASNQEQHSQAARTSCQDYVAALFMAEDVQTAFELKEKVLNLLLHAITNSVTLIITESAATTSALQILAAATDGSALILVEDLLSNCRTLLKHLSQSKSKEDDVLHERLLQLISTDMLPVFTAYTADFVIQAVQQLAAAAEMHTAQQQQLHQQQQQLHQQQQQQQHSGEVEILIQQHCQTIRLLKQYRCAANHAAAVVLTWKVLLIALQATAERILQPVPGFVPAFSAAVHLTAVAAPLLVKGFLLCSSSSSAAGQSTTGSHQYARDALTTALKVLVSHSVNFCQPTAMLISNVTNALPALNRHAGSLYQQQQLLQQQLLSTGKLPELLLLTLAYQVAALHAAYVRHTAAEQSSEPSAAAEQQQRRQQPQQGILNSHNVIVSSLGLPYEINRMANIAAEDYKVSACGRAIWALRTLIELKTQAATTTSSSSSSSGSRQLPHINPLDEVFPKELILLSVRLLLETLLLLPAQDIANRVESLQLMLLLLRLVAAEHTDLQPLSAAAFPQAEETSSSAAAASAKLLLPQLPAAVAAGLLHPVVRMLSRAVMQALKETEPKQQQSDSQSIPPARADQDAERMTLLRSFGEVLMTVCQSVEPKHIAAALRCDDPVIPLVAIEAVIRAHASAPAAASQHQPENSSNDSSTHHPQAAVLLLPFITKIVRALQLLVKDQPGLQQAKSSDAAAAAAVSDTFVIRILSLITTACKVGTRARDQWLKCRKLQSQDAQQLPSTAGTATAAAAMGGKEATEELIKWLMKAPPAIREIAAELTTHMHHRSSSSSSSSTIRSVNCTDTGAAGRYDQHRRNKGKNAKPGLQHSKGCKQAGSSTAAAAASSAAAMSSAQQQSGSCSILPLVVLVKMMSASAAHLVGAHHLVAETAEAWAQQAVDFVAVSKINDSETPATAAMLWPFAMVSTGCGTAFMALTGLTIGIANALQSMQLQHICSGSDSSYTGARQPSEQWLKQQLKHLSNLQQLSDSIFQGKFGKKVLVRDEDGCPELITITPSFFAADHLGQGNGTVGSGGLPSENSAQKHGSTAKGHATARSNASHRAECNEQQMADIYKQLNEFALKVLASLAVPFICNNPSCVNLSKLSEYQLVSGKACVCGGCKVARYCSRECQKKHWKQHRPRCSQISRVS